VGKNGEGPGSFVRGVRASWEMEELERDSRASSESKSFVEMSSFFREELRERQERVVRVIRWGSACSLCLVLLWAPRTADDSTAINLSIVACGR
jgi:hypothetical protein